MPVCDICPLGTICVHWDAGYGSAMALALTAYPAPERAILTDLITELRGSDLGHTPRPSLGNYVCNSCGEVWPCHTEKGIKRAEQRLREVSPEVSPTATVAPDGGSRR